MTEILHEIKLSPSALEESFKTNVNGANKRRESKVHFKNERAVQKVILEDEDLIKVENVIGLSTEKPIPIKIEI